MGACSFEEFSRRAGCGDRLADAFEKFLEKRNSFVEIRSTYLILVILFDIFQAVAIGLTTFIYIKMNAKTKRTDAQVIYRMQRSA